MEDTLKILKVEYLSNLSVLPQLFNLSLGEQPKLKIAVNKDEVQWKMTYKY